MKIHLERVVSKPRRECWLPLLMRRLEGEGLHCARCPIQERQRSGKLCQEHLANIIHLTGCGRMCLRPTSHGLGVLPELQFTGEIEEEGEMMGVGGITEIHIDIPRSGYAANNQNK